MTDDDYDFDEAWYDLGDDRRYAGADDEFREAYARVLVRLPPNVRRFALQRCFVVSIGHGSGGGTTWPLSIIDKRRRRWLIVCDENGPGHEDGIAHEAAHAWRGDDKTSADLDPNHEKGCG